MQYLKIFRAARANLLRVESDIRMWARGIRLYADQVCKAVVGFELHKEFMRGGDESFYSDGEYRCIYNF